MRDACESTETFYKFKFHFQYEPMLALHKSPKTMTQWS